MKAFAGVVNGLPVEKSESVCMTVKLFILGLPGSGKSTVARHISSYARGRQWSTTHFYDFAILYEMFMADTQGQFKPADAEYGGFDVLDLAVFDTALRKLEQKVKAHISTAHLEEIILIEFSRNDYEKAFQQFSREFLQDAYFLYLRVDLEICKRRIRERIAKPNTVDDHFVSEYIFEAYYNEDNGQSIPQILKGKYKIGEYRVKIIDNGGSQAESSALFNQFIDVVFAFEAHRLRETEPIQRITDKVVGGELERK
jgi:adenylate kinase family enzyme